MKTAAMRKVHADGNPNMPRVKKLSPQEWSLERYQSDLKRNMQIQKEMQDREEARRQQVAMGRPAQAQMPLTQQQMIAAAAQQRRTAATAATVNATQQSNPPQTTNQTLVKPNGIQNGTVNGMGVAGMTPTQMQQLQAYRDLQAANRLGQQSTPNPAQLALQQRQLQQMGQLPSQTLVAAHLSPAGGNMQNHQQQQMIAAALQQRQLANANGMANMMHTSPTSAASNMHLQARLVQYMRALQSANPNASPESIKAEAMKLLRQEQTSHALASASGNPTMGGLNNLPSQSSALAQQHMGMHGTSTQAQAQAQLMAYMQAQQQAQQNGGIGLPAQGLAAALQQQQQNGGAPNGITNSPTQMYRHMSAQQAHAVAAHQSRMNSGSPNLGPVARPESRGGSGTPVPSAMMARSMSNMSGGAQSPILGQTGSMNGGR
jgi:hypothetical protein